MHETPFSRGVLFLLAFAISLGSFLFVLDYSVANVSIPYIAGDLAVSVDQGTYVITSFTVGNAIGLPISGWLTRRVGAIRLICVALLLFSLFSFTCGMASNIEMLVISRFLQGLAAGPIIPLSQTLMLKIHPPEKRTWAMAMWSTIVIAAPIVGPMLGGWISYDYYWPWIFFINVPLGILSACVIWFFLKTQDTPREKIRTDYMGLIFLSVGVCCLQFLLDKGEQYDWWRSDLILSCGIISTICFAFLIVWSLTTEDPLINLRLFKKPTFAVSVFYIAIIYALYFGTVILVPLWLQTAMNYTAIWAGLAVAPMGVVPFVLGPFMGKMVTRFGTASLLALAFVCLSFSCFYAAYLDTDADFFHVALSRFLLGPGIVLFITPLFVLSTVGIPDKELPSATGIFHFVRSMMGGVGASVFTTLWIRRAAFHHARINESLTPYSPNTHTYLDNLSSQGLSSEQTWQSLNDTLTIQASTMSINDCFFLMGWLFLALMLFIPFARSSRTQVTHSVSMD